MRTNQFTLGFDCKQMLTPVARVANNSEILHGMERDCVLDRVISQDAQHLKHVPALTGGLHRSLWALCDSGIIMVRLSMEVPQTGRRPGLREVSAISPIR